MNDPRFVVCDCCGVYFHAGGGSYYNGTRTNSEGDLVDCYLCERCGSGECDCEDLDEQQQMEEDWRGTHAPHSVPPWLSRREWEGSED